MYFSKYTTVWLFALILAVSITLALLGVHHWYFLGVVGAWGASARLRDSWPRLREYWLLFLLGAAIELCGRMILGLWSYPFITTRVLELLIIVFYPFILWSFANTYVLLRSKLTALGSTLASMAIGILIWEMPNLASHDWIYAVSWYIWVSGWILLIWLPIITIEADI